MNRFWLLRPICLHLGPQEMEEQYIVHKETGASWTEPQLGFCLARQPCTLVRLQWADRAPFSKLCKGDLCRFGEALFTTAKIYRVYLQHRERRSASYLRQGWLVKVTFMLSLTIAHISEIQRIRSQMSEAVKRRKK